jgi:hypothetical protein
VGPIGTLVPTASTLAWDAIDGTVVFSVWGDALARARNKDAPTCADDSASATVRRAMREPSGALIWARALDPLDGADPALAALLVSSAGAKLTPFVPELRWLADHVYEVLLTASIDKDAGDIMLHVTTFTNDPKDARAAYDAALVFKYAGDQTKYKDALVALRKQWPSSLVARQAGLSLAGHPILTGPGMLLAYALGQL